MKYRIKKILIAYYCLIVVPIEGVAGDVSGRNLNYPGLGWLGHVAMWTGGSGQQLEVLNEAAVIQLNTLSNFKSRSPYWGARYGKGQNFYTMISKGWDQSSYKPTFTAAPVFQEGKWERKCVRYQKPGRCVIYGNVMTAAMFRCDTFVNFMYKKGTGSWLADPTFPRTTFAAMPIPR